MVLPEIVRSSWPQASVLLMVAADGPTACPVRFKVLVEFVESSKPHLVEVLVGLHPVVGVQAVVAIARAHAVPSLTCALVIADVFIAQFQRPLIINIGKTTIVAATLAVGAVDETICARAVICTIDDEVVFQQSTRERTAKVPCIIRTTRERQFQCREGVGKLRGQSHSSTKGPVAVG